jgi:polyisoprenoid-binding protein YceI
MTRNRWLAVAIVAIVAVVAVGAYVAYDQFLRGDDVAPLALGSPAPSAAGSAQPTVSSAPSATPAAGDASPAASAAGVSPAASPATAASTAPSAAGAATPVDLAGTWNVGSGSVAGYRVREQLGGVSALTDAVGRTSDVAGSATLVEAGDGVRVTDASFRVDLTTLKSDNDRRDGRLRQMAIESDRFPTTTFVLTAPIDVPAAALAGETVDVILVGDLDLHGVKRSVSIPAKARLADGRIEVVGSITFPFSDFSIVPPDIGGFVKVEPDGTLEFLVSLQQA